MFTHFLSCNTFTYALWYSITAMPRNWFPINWAFSKLVQVFSMKILIQPLDSQLQTQDRPLQSPDHQLQSPGGSLQLSGYQLRPSSSPCDQNKCNVRCNLLPSSIHDILFTCTVHILHISWYWSLIYLSQENKSQLHFCNDFSLFCILPIEEMYQK